MLFEPMIWMFALAGIFIGCGLMMSKNHSGAARQAREKRKAELRRIAIDRGGDLVLFSDGSPAVDYLSRFPALNDYFGEEHMRDLRSVAEISYRKDGIEFYALELSRCQSLDSGQTPWTIFASKPPYGCLISRFNPSAD